MCNVVKVFDCSIILVNFVIVFDCSVVVVVDVSPIWNRTHLDQEILKLLHIHQNTSSVLVLNKVSQLL